MWIMTDCGWQLLGGPMTPCEPLKKWWHFAQADKAAYDRLFKRSDGTDFRDGSGRRLID